MPRKKKTEETAIIIDPETGEDILEKIEREANEEEKKNKSKKTKKNEPEKVVPASFTAKAINVEIEFITDALGVSPMNPDIYGNYIATKIVKDESGIGPKEKVERVKEEIEVIQTTLEEEDALNEKGLTGYPRTKVARNPKTGMLQAIKPEHEVKGSKVNYPFTWDYQWKGFFKEAMGAIKLHKYDTTKKKDIGGNEAINFSDQLRTHKKTVDLAISIHPRKIPLELPEFYYDVDGVTKLPTIDSSGRLKINQRSLRISGPQERVAIAISEQVPAGTRMKFTIDIGREDLVDLVMACLDYGERHGFSGWRNAGYGRFRYRLYPDGWDKEPLAWNVEVDDDDPFEY